MSDKIIKFLPIEDLEIKSIDEKKRVIWHKITKEVKDLMGDIVRIDGMDLKLFKKKPAVLYGHDYVGGKPVPVIGEGIGFKREGKALYAGTKFHDTSTDEMEMSQALRDLVNDNWYLHKKKLLGWSIGIIPKKIEELKNKEEDFLGYDIKESQLLEYSSCIIPTNQEAINDAFKRGQISPTFMKSLETYRENLELPGDVATRQIEEEKKEDIVPIPEKPHPEMIAYQNKIERENDSQKQGITPDSIKALRAITGALRDSQRLIAEYLQKFTGGKK